MASSFQRQALHRKLIYAGLILVLFTASYLWRTTNFSILGRQIKGVDAQASDLAIREQSRGEVDWIGAIARLTTIGSRGVATCWLWMNAMEAQKKNQWNELEMYVRSLTKLQPHFITPWIFQSWNLAYNVSVESDRVNDKYFYISRGIGLLAQGEKQNRDNPDMRWSIGFFMQHKIGQSDETNTLRSLSQLSMIPPNERDPGRFWSGSEGRREINLKELEDFCQKHPQLARRLREGMRRERKSDQLRQFRCERADEFVQFLEDNYRLPSLWVSSLPSAPGAWKPKEDKFKPLADRFPVLPPSHEIRPYQQLPDKTALNDESKLRDEDDAYQVSRAWFSYAQEPLPKPDKLPGSNEPIENRVYQRIPRHMTTVIFRTYPAQAQRYTAERLQDEGWFDESGWEVPDWFRASGDRFADGERAVVGGGRKWGLEAWERTRELWQRFGEDNHFLTDPAEQNRLESRALAFAKKYHLNPMSQPPALREEDLDAETREEYFAWRFLRLLSQYSTLCNFPYHFNRAQVESRPETIQARKTFFESLDLQRLKNDELGAFKKYLEPSGMKAWRDKVLMSNKVFRRDSLVQEHAFEVQLRYVNLYAQLNGRTFKTQVARMLLMPSLNPPGGGACPVALANWMPPLIEKDWNNPLLGGPFDGNDDEGQPLIGQIARDSVLHRLFPALYSGQQQAPPPSQARPAKGR
ncbi:MAG TPA: hypothetical protein VMG10_06740 [Gemmataceae bacterium]|nr:hypothetical protein [Gemmataceae bacterium]